MANVWDWRYQEKEFEVYEPYCANYTHASELMVAQEQNLMVSLLHFRLGFSGSCLCLLMNIPSDTGVISSRFGVNPPCLLA